MLANVTVKHKMWMMTVTAPSDLAHAFGSASMSLAEPLWLVIWGAALIGIATLARSRARQRGLARVAPPVRATDLQGARLETVNG